ncbi:MAG: family 20 glycosylhydrolase [Gemmatimonadota bacterium]
MTRALLLALLFPANLAAQTPADQLIPQVSHAVALPGTWHLPDTLRVVINRPAAAPVVGLLREILPRPVVAGARNPNLRLQVGSGPASNESYTLRISEHGAEISAPSISGLRWGAQTLRQLIADTDAGMIGAMEIRDAPRFGWRGAMLDVGRHFFPASDILRWIDVMARYKLNVFHWHLTEDQGWRLAINTYPRLTSVGGWRTEVDGSRSGGFYTQAEVRRVVAYAAMRGVTVVPEIEMPGHARAALAAYPALGCTGAQLSVPPTWGVFEDVLCPTEPTFRFLEAVLTEVLALFPSEYIHIGGDEVPKARWRACALCQATVVREGLGDDEGLQRWFTARIADFLGKHHRRMIGWDEILNGGAPKGAVVQAWQGSDRIAVALKAGADVIASPAEWVYINRSARELPLERILRFDPRAGTDDSLRVLGGEAPLWTENVISPANVEMMLFPRLIGFAETMWRGPAELGEFQRRLTPEQRRLESSGIAFGPAAADLPGIALRYDSTANLLSASLVNPLPGVVIRSTSSGQARLHPDGMVPLSDTGMVTLQLVRGDSRIRDAHRITIVSHLARGKPVVLANPPEMQYPGTGAHTLTDGAQGSDYHDGLWNGWLGHDLDARIDLGQMTTVHSVALSLLEEVRSWIVYPSAVRVELSDDGTTWRAAGGETLGLPVTLDGRSLRTVTITIPAGGSARWIRVVATNGGTLPAWHPGAGNASWIFADEVIVR